MYRIPYLKVLGPDGTDQIPVWGSRLIGVQLVTRADDETDECTFKFTNGAPYATAPGELTPYTVSIGWSTDAAALGGIYLLERIHLLGQPKRGEEIHYVCRAGSTDDLHQVDSQHFSPDNGNATLGDVFHNLFPGQIVDVALSIAALPVPGGHLLRWNQSAIDFATDVANNAGASVKPMGGKIIVTERGSGQSVSGTALATLTIQKQPGYMYDVEIEPRFQYQSVSANYFDDATGRLKIQSSPSQGSSGGSDGLPHPAPDQAAATAQATAVANEMRRFTGTGIFEMPGEPAAVAGCDCTCFGFPDPIDTLPWMASVVTHDVVPDRGWTTSVETETKTD